MIPNIGRTCLTICIQRTLCTIQYVETDEQDMVIGEII